MSVNERICIGSDAIVRIIGANQLANGDYTIVYTLSESNTSINTTLVTIAGGSSSFTIPENVLQNPDGEDHQNIRNFMQTGWDGVVFSRNALIAKS